MKHCPSCKSHYDSDFEYCPSCGSQLSPLVATPRIATVFLLALAILFVVFTSIHEHQKFTEQQEAIENYQTQKYFEELRNTPKTSDLKIDSGWTHKIKGDYIYIDGSVTNTSSKFIDYYEIGVEFLDSTGKVVDTDWTNGTDVSSYTSQEFSLMHKWNSKYSKINLYIKEVS